MVECLDLHNLYRLLQMGSSENRINKHSTLRALSLYFSVVCFIASTTSSIWGMRINWTMYRGFSFFFFVFTPLPSFYITSILRTLYILFLKQFIIIPFSLLFFNSLLCSSHIHLGKRLRFAYIYAMRYCMKQNSFTMRRQ